MCALDAFEMKDDCTHLLVFLYTYAYLMLSKRPISSHLHVIYKRLG